MRANRDIDVLWHMIRYCEEIDRTVERFGHELEIFAADSVYKNAVALCVLQIGELTTKLSDEFKSTYRGIPWFQIKALRNVVAHDYGKIDEVMLWETVTNDIPVLKEYCHSTMEQLMTIQTMREHDAGPTLSM